MGQQRTASFLAVESCCCCTRARVTVGGRGPHSAALGVHLDRTYDTPASSACIPSHSGTAALQPLVLRGNASNEMREVVLGQAFDCTSPLHLHWLLPAAWNLSVVGRDPAGNVAAPQTYAWRVAYAQGEVYTRFLRCARCAAVWVCSDPVAGKACGPR